MENTTNYNLKKPATSDYYNVQDQNDNMDILDTALTPTADPSQVPSGNVGKLAQWISWLTNRIKAITGGVNWYDAPPITLTEANNLISNNLAKMNILHNWDFRNPVNQRGSSSYVTGSEYSLDRWLIQSGGGNATLTVNTGYCTFTGVATSSLIRQYLEFPTLYCGMTLTVSANIDGVIYSGSGNIPETLPTSPTTFITATFPNGELTVRGYTGHLYVNIVTTATINIYTAKLEVGSVSTLANDAPADYGEQLELCQRYCLVIDNYMYARMTSYLTNCVDFFIPTPATMRIIPSISGGGFSVNTLAGGLQSGFTFSIVAKHSDGLLLRATKSSHGLTDAMLATAGTTILSADL